VQFDSNDFISLAISLLKWSTFIIHHHHHHHHENAHTDTLEPDGVLVP